MANQLHFFVPDHWPEDSDWTPVLRRALSNSEFVAAQQQVAQRRNQCTVYPPAADVFNAFRYSAFSSTKVLILGQDPYHGEGQAHGLAFSVLGNQKLPPSLKNIFKELKDDLSVDNQTGNLTAWAKQGVLLLNTVLTVESGNANSHKNIGWEAFTDQVIDQLGRRDSPCIFVLWGNQAAKKRPLIGSQHTVIASPHPSPLSAHRGFFGSRPFSTINQQLVQFGHAEISWQL